MSASKVKIKKIAKSIKPAGIFWVDDANCVGRDPVDFIYGSDNPSKKTRASLTKICSDCKVIETCRLEAIRNMEVGWWGGMDEKERLDWAIENLSFE